MASLSQKVAMASVYTHHASNEKIKDDCVKSMLGNVLIYIKRRSSHFS